MPSKAQQLRQRFLLTGAGLALALVIPLYWLGSGRARATLEGLANDRGREAANRASELVSEYLRERRRETQALALSPAVVPAARQAGQEVGQRSLADCAVDALERMFAGRRAFGGDAELAEHFKLYADEDVRGALPRHWADVREGQRLPTMAKGPMTVTGFIAYAQGWGGLYIRAKRPSTSA